MRFGVNRLNFTHASSDNFSPIRIACEHDQPCVHSRLRSECRHVQHTPLEPRGFQRKGEQVTF
jgi:hypothetical protein